jgi:hypothetical protein
MAAESCFTIISDVVASGYAFATSEPGDLCVAAIATVRAIVYYCVQSRYPEARELASIVIVGSMLISAIAVAESRFPTAVREVFSCKRSGTEYADAPGRTVQARGDR